MALSIKQELAINELIKGNSIVDSAKNINTSVDTLNRWLCDEEFKEVLEERKKQIIDNCIDSINLLGSKAIKVLNEILDDSMVSDNVRFNASKSILEFILKFNEQSNIINKMKEIEELLIDKVADSNG